MDDWKKRVLGNQLEQLRPPAFVLYADGEGRTSGSKRRSTVIREHYRQVSDFLEEHSYHDLVKMADRIRTRRSEIETRSSELIDSRIYYVRAQYIAFQREHPEMDADLLPSNTGDRQSSLDQPIGKAWLDEDGGIKSNGGWEVETKDGHDASKPPLSRMEISIPPEAISDARSKAGSSEKVNLEKTKSRINREDLHPSDHFEFTGDTTWSEVIDAFEDQLSSFAEEKDRISRVRELLGFRAEIARVVLSRVEMFGEVPDMKDEDTGELTEHSGPTARRSDTHQQIMTWQENAAQFYAYLQSHGRPESKSDLEDETKLSTRQAWDQLKERGYGVGKGLDGLISALEKWAPEFEERYGRKKAIRAAKPFDWPRQQET